jgi:hypothetical protein
MVDVVIVYYRIFLKRFDCKLGMSVKYCCCMMHQGAVHDTSETRC